MCPPSDVPLFRRSRSCRPPLCSALALLRPRPPGLPNIPAFALGTIFTGIFYKNCVADANWLPGNRNMHVAGVAGSVALVTGIAAMLDTTTAISALGWIGGSLSPGCPYLSQWCHCHLTTTHALDPGCRVCRGAVHRHRLRDLHVRRAARGDEDGY